MRKSLVRFAADGRHTWDGKLYAERRRRRRKTTTTTTTENRKKTVHDSSFRRVTDKMNVTGRQDPLLCHSARNRSFSRRRSRLRRHRRRHRARFPFFRPIFVLAESRVSYVRSRQADRWASTHGRISI